MSRVGVPAAAPVLAQIKVGCLRAGDCAGVWAPCVVCMSEAHLTVGKVQLCH